MLVLGMDLETTGLNVAEDHIIEIGGMLWDTERNVPMNPVLSTFVNPGEHVTVTEEITKINGIADADVKAMGFAPVVALKAFVQLMEKAEYIVAHNGNIFDKPFLENFAARHGVEIPKKIWIDTTTDVEFPPAIQTRKLVHLAAEHGFINPFAHRAIFDVSTMLQIAGRYDWEQITRYAKSPTLVVAANVSYHQRELAKKQNFRWHGEDKTWRKSLKDFQLEPTRKACAEAGFSISVLQGV